MPKKHGSQRPVINLKDLNNFVSTEHFKMEGIHVLRDLPKVGDWMAKVDHKDGYFMIPMHEEDRAFLKFSFKKNTYQFRCLPFGLACAPWVFTKILKPLTAQLRQLGMRMIIYIDDIPILAESKERAQDHVMGLLYLLQNLGFEVSKPKCVLDPVQVIDFLGFMFDSVQQELSLPAGKVKKIRAETRHILEGSQVTARKLSGSNQGNSPGSAVLPPAAAGTSKSTGAIRSRLFSPVSPLHGGAGGAAVVLGPSVNLEWQDIYVRAGSDSVPQAKLHSQRDITLVAEHLPGVLNVVADKES